MTQTPTPYYRPLKCFIWHICSLSQGLQEIFFIIDCCCLLFSHLRSSLPQIRTYLPARTVLNAAYQQHKNQALKNLSAVARRRKVFSEIGQSDAAQSSGLPNFFLCWCIFTERHSESSEILMLMKGKMKSRWFDNQLQIGIFYQEAQYGERQRKRTAGFQRMTNGLCFLSVDAATGNCSISWKLPFFHCFMTTCEECVPQGHRKESKGWSLSCFWTWKNIHLTQLPIVWRTESPLNSM